jgi:hypothetical protein
MRDLVHIGSLKSYPAWAELSERRGWGQLDQRVTEEEAALLWFRLRTEPDHPETFPHGKWASVQALEDLLHRALEKEAA